jgi:peptide/nickel transport system permease protein
VKIDFVPLPIDLFFFASLIAVGFYVRYALGNSPLRATWGVVFKKPIALSSAMILLCFVLLALLDSVHFRTSEPGGDAAHAHAVLSEPQSVLDVILKPLALARERTYSAPLSAYGFRKETILRDGAQLRDYPRLRFGAAHLKNPETDLQGDVLVLLAKALGWALLVLMCTMGLAWLYRSWRHSSDHFAPNSQSSYPIKTFYVTLFVIYLTLFVLIELSSGYHVLGTDQTGNSVLLIAIKSIRTALVIGTLTTLVIMPIALVLGVMAGYFRGWVDEFIQYVYTVIASVPDVLLIAATVLMLQVFIDSHAQFFPSTLERSDLRLLFLCLILGLTSFTGLCRLIRGETLKIRELEFIQAAKAFGVSHARILRAHITPNLMHLVLINCVMQFSSFILSEAVLSYVGVGVDPNTASFGVMINAAREELSATPVIWWTLMSAFVFMFLLVISANLLADAVREAFDPKAANLKRGV